MTELHSLYVTLYLDEDVTNQLANLLRERGFDVVAASELGMNERPDEEHLTFAATQSRTLLTYNESDFIALARQWASEGRSHAGILISDQFSLRQTGELLRRLLNFLNQVTTEEMVSVVRYLADFK